MQTLNDTVSILIVDDDEDIALAIRDYLSGEPGLVPVVTNDPKMVSTILSENKQIQIVISDYRMPGTDGLELLLEIKSRFPRVHFMFMTGYSTPDLKLEALRKGAFRYLEKPFEFRELVRNIREAMGISGQGFGGTVERIGLSDIIQLIGLSRRTVTLEIHTGRDHGRMFFKDGELVHAECGNLAGVDAFHRIFNWSGGQFSLGAQVTDCERTINVPWQGLLLEATNRKERREMKPTPTNGNGDGPFIPAGDPAKTAQGAGAEEELTSFSFTDLEPGLPAEAPKEPAREEILIDLYQSTENEENGNGKSTEQDSGLREKIIGEILSAAVDKCMTLWPENAASMNYVLLKHLKLPWRFIRSFLDFHFEELAMLTIRTDVEAFDFSRPEMRDALETFRQNLKNNWNVSYERFRQLVFDAVLFETAYVIDPAQAVAQVLMEKAEAERMTPNFRLRKLLDCGVLDKTYSALTTDIGRFEDPEIKAYHLEDYMRLFLRRRETAEKYRGLRNAVLFLAELFQLADGREVERIHARTLYRMLDNHGLEDFRAELETKQTPGNDAFSVHELDGFMEQFEMKEKQPS